MNIESGSSAIVRGAYLVGAVGIVLITLAIGWICVWKFMLSRMKLVRELLDLNSTTPLAPQASFDERLKQYKENPMKRRTGSTLMSRQED
ncbi:hypothetical protein THRCLA_20045 [Thraustotheca clavata]|uniref:Uncharacterized protein n=1 Tax=Thraustotheca clavata TaxID=74557 RepID=A0A1W0ACV4_9STRA|nr:hypothetical protein THRCLA_20045 [Thraustotheca clavata]